MYKGVNEFKKFINQVLLDAVNSGVCVQNVFAGYRMCSLTVEGVL